MNAHSCRFCKKLLTHVFVNLGMSPLSNAFVETEHDLSPETFHPLCAFVCEECFLVQLPAVETPDNIFSEYVYFSSYSQSWLDHCKSYVDMMTKRFSLDSSSLVIEIASNDGYLLQYFRENEIPVLGVEPAANVAKVAQEKGVNTLVKFFGIKTSREILQDAGGKADVLLGNNVLAHVPDINDFVGGMKSVLASEGVITMEFPHLLQLIKQNQFDTIYHEHFSYLSMETVRRIFSTHGLRLFDVEEIPTHGGSIRVFACHEDDKSKPTLDSVDLMSESEKKFGLNSLYCYQNFSDQVNEIKRELLKFLIKAKEDGKSVAGYGAPAKGNTLLNYCGIREDLLAYTVDRNPHKQGKLLPGTHIPVHDPEIINTTKPHYLLILPWNLQEEVIAQMSHIREWKGQFVVPIPSLKVL